MNEEIKNENMDLIEVEPQDMEDTIVESEESGSGVLGKLVLGGVLLAAAGGGMAFLRKKNKNKIEERRIKQLEKAGYRSWPWRSFPGSQGKIQRGQLHPWRYHQGNTVLQDGWRPCNLHGTE